MRRVFLTLSKGMAVSYSRLVVSGADVTEEQVDRIYERELKRISRKFTHMRYHSFLMYFGVLKRLRLSERQTAMSR